MPTTHTGTYKLGPETATLKVWTGKEGKVAKVGHNLEIEVSDWSATLSLGDSPQATTLTLSANSRSLRVLTGSGGMQKVRPDCAARQQHRGRHRGGTQTNPPDRYTRHWKSGRSPGRRGR